MVGPPSSRGRETGRMMYAKTVRRLSTRVSVTFPPAEVAADHCLGGHVLLKAAVLLLIVWLLGVIGVYNVGALVHILLLVGLMLLLLGVLQARDAAAQGRPGSGDGAR